MNKSIFFDRDNTLIVDVPYLKDPDQVVLMHGARDALARLEAAGYLIFLFTNQSGIGRGYYTEVEANACNDRMIELLGRFKFAEICIAPEHPDAPAVYRKPSPRFILEMVAKYSLDKRQTWMVGDKDIDIEAGKAAGVHTAHIGTQYASVAAFADALLKHEMA
ncbi:MAG TPA: HAD family hydrolase [Opitutae bacterium]|nr:HAD family hydrolase [Opitutae bacterium]